KQPGLQHKQIIFHQDNAPTHKSVLSMFKFNELKYKLLDHPLYSPDLAPSDFRNLKQFLRGKHFLSNEEAIAAVEAYFVDFPETYFRDGVFF
ncbi:Histone-lysine N-methyltransferase SETMAR, partial [Harpegnathos saltator]